MNTKRALLFGCSSAMVLAVAVLAALLVWFAHVSQDPPNVAISVEGPHEVSAGEEFILTILVENQREDQVFELTAIDIAESYLDHFLVLGTNPPARTITHIPIDKTRSFSFDQPVPALETTRFEFNLRPAATGVFRGKVDVCEGQRFLTTMLETMVTRER